MTQVQVDQSLKQMLGGLENPIELCGPDGNVVGRYLPEAEYKKILYGTLQIPYSDDEITRRRAQTGGSSLEDIWRRVGRA